MKKQYPIEKLSEVQTALKTAPTKTVRFIGHTQALQKLQTQIRNLYVKKNYEPKEIVELMRESGVKVTILEVKNLLKSKEKAKPNLPQPTKKASASKNVTKSTQNRNEKSS